MKKEDDTLENCIQLCAKIDVVLLHEIKVIFHNSLFSGKMCVSPAFGLTRLSHLSRFYTLKLNRSCRSLPIFLASIKFNQMYGMNE